MDLLVQHQDIVARWVVWHKQLSAPTLVPALAGVPSYLAAMYVVGAVSSCSAVLLAPPATRPAIPQSG
jgi:hypothetical protein